MFLKFRNPEEKSHYLIFVVMTIASLTSFAMNLSADGVYRGIFMLPLAFFIFSIIFIKIFHRMSLPHFVVVILMAIRYVIAPLLLAVEGYPLDRKYIVLNEDSVTLSLVLMIYEMFVLFLALNINSKRIISEDKNTLMNTHDEVQFEFERLNILTVLIVLLTFALFCAFPALFSTYKFIFSQSMDAYMGKSSSNSVRLPFGVRWIGYCIGEITRFVLIEWIILKLHNRYTKRGKALYWWLSLIVISGNALFTTDRIALGLILSLVFYQQIYKLYPVYRRRLYIFLTVFGSIGIVFIFMLYLGYSIQMGSLSLTLQSYVGSYKEVYQSICAYKARDLSFFDKMEMLLIGDGISRIVIISSFLSTEYNFYLNQSNFNSGRVVPMVVQSSYYFSSLIGPWVSFVCMRVMNRYEMRVHRGGRNMAIDLYTCLILAVAPFMFNNSVLIHVLTNIILPLFIMSVLNRRVVVRRKC